MTKFRKKCASLAERRPGPGRRSSARRAASFTKSLSEKYGPERPAPAVRTECVREREHENPARPDQEPAGFSYGPAPVAAATREAVSRRTKRTVWDGSWSPRLSARNRKFIRRSNRRKNDAPAFHAGIHSLKNGGILFQGRCRSARTAPGPEVTGAEGAGGPAPP